MNCFGKFITFFVCTNEKYPYLCHPIRVNAEIAQLVEHDLAKVGVASSSLVFRSKHKRQPSWLSFVFSRRTRFARAPPFPRQDASGISAPQYGCGAVWFILPPQSRRGKPFSGDSMKKCAGDSFRGRVIRCSQSMRSVGGCCVADRALPGGSPRVPCPMRLERGRTLCRGKNTAREKYGASSGRRRQENAYLCMYNTLMPL